MSNNRIITVVCGVVAAAGLTGAGAALAQAATPDAATAATSAATSTSAPNWGPYPLSSRGPSRDTAVTGGELAKVKAAVNAKDSAVTVTSVRQDPDGSYDVFASKSGAPVMLQVSKDLKTINTRTGGPGEGHHGPRPGDNHTPVTGGELAEVKAAVNAKDSAVTVTSVRQDPDGSYDVFGTKSGAPVMLQVSKDLKTINTRTGGPGEGHHGPRPGDNHTPVTGGELAKVKAAVNAKDSAVTVTSVRQDPDGSYDVFGTKSGAPVMLQVSKDLKTITTGPSRAPASQQEDEGTSTSL